MNLQAPHANVAWVVRAVVSVVVAAVVLVSAVVAWVTAETFTNNRTHH